jgi:hypothetical protein
MRCRQILILCRLQESAQNDKQKKAGPCQSRPNLRRKEKPELNLISAAGELPDAVDRALARRQVAATILPHFAAAAKSLTEFPEFGQLPRGEHFSKLQFASKSQFCHLGLRELELL